jgi:molybdopterin-guanine dinucleotide biosynthesis protein MobB
MPSTPSFVIVAGLKKSGKTTVAAALIGELARRGLRVASVKSMRHGALDLEPEGADTRRHLEAGAEAAIAFADDEEAVFARRSAGEPRERLERWLPPDIDWVVCEGLVDGLPADRVVLCLERVEDLAEALAVRGLDTPVLVAVSGIAAGAAPPAAPLPAPLFDATDPGDLERLADLVLAR